MAETTKSRKIGNPYHAGKSNFIKRSNEILDKLKEDGIIKEISLGAKFCLPTNKLSYDVVDKIKSLLGTKEDGKYSDLSMNKNGWLAVSVLTDTGENPGATIQEALDEYRAHSDEDKDIFISSYGEAEITIDYSKLGMLQLEDGSILYPYGAFFFSDNKTLINQFSASVACVPARYNKIRNKKNISPITADNWDNATITCNFTKRGHLVLFYVTEEIEKDKDVYNPIVTTIDIELFAHKDYKTSNITRISFGRADKVTKCVPDIVEYLITDFYYKYGMRSFISSQFMGDYIYSIGCNPRNYNLEIPAQPESHDDDKTKIKFKSNFVGGTANNRAKATEKSEVASQPTEEIETEGVTVSKENEVEETVATDEDTLDTDIDAETTESTNESSTIENADQQLDQESTKTESDTEVDDSEETVAEDSKENNEE